MNDWIDLYSPMLPADHWEPISAFVREAVRDSVAHTRYDPPDLLPPASRFVDWTHRVRGIELSRALVFAPTRIGEFVARGCPDVEPATAGNYRTRLLRMTEALNPGVLPPRMPPLPPSPGAAPYTASEEARLWVWANGHGRDRYREGSKVLLAGCLGAGLTAREVCDLRRFDVHVDELGVILTVTGVRAREVAVLASVEHVLIDAIDGLSPDRFVFDPGRRASNKNTASNFLSRCSPSPVPVSSQRARATWVINHLRRGVPIQALMTAMGIEDFSAISRYLQHVPALDWADYRSHLRALSEEP